MPDDTLPTTSQPADPPSLSDLEAAVARNPADGESWWRLAEAYAQARAFDLALPAYESAVRFSRDEGASWHGLARTRMQLGDTEGALPAALRAVELGPGRASRRLLLARILGTLGKSHQAILHLEHALFLNPRRADLYEDLGHARLALSEFNAAREAYEMARLLDPDLDVWHPLAYCFLRLEWWKQAADTLKELVSLRPADGMAWARLGAAYRETGRTDDGARALARSLELGYDEPWVWFESGLAAATLDDRPALQKARDVLSTRDAELARRLETRVHALAEGAAAGSTASEDRAPEPDAREEAPSC
jgi:tetratricopeptide (TPR) repeat protein